MEKTIKIAACALLLLLAAAPLSYADGKPAAPGYLLGILLGYGTGHLYFGDSAGSVYLIGEIAGTAAVLAGGVFLFSSTFGWTDPSSAWTATMIGWIVAGAGALVLEIFHIAEIVDIFRAADVARNAGRVSGRTLDFSITPVNFGVRYRF